MAAPSGVGGDDPEVVALLGAIPVARAETSSVASPEPALGLLFWLPSESSFRTGSSRWSGCRLRLTVPSSTALEELVLLAGCAVTVGGCGGPVVKA